MPVFIATLKELFGSKKFLTTLTGILAILVGKIGWNVDEETLWMMVTIIAACITGQGMADFGKAKTPTP